MRKPKAVTCHEFIQFTEDEKAELIKLDGVYIGKTIKSGIIVLLYQLEDFYIEIYYSSFRSEINRFECTKDTSVLDEYFL